MPSRKLTLLIAIVLIGASLTIGLSVLFAPSPAVESEIPVTVQGSVRASTGAPLEAANIVILEGETLERGVANLTVGAEGSFTFTHRPTVSFLNDTGVSMSQAFLSFRIVAAGIDAEDNPWFLHTFRSLRFRPGEVEKAAEWPLELEPYTLPPAAQLAPPSAHAQRSSHLTTCFAGLCQFLEEDLGVRLTKVGEVHTTAGAKTTFKFGASSAVTTEVGVSYDNWASYSISAGAVWSRGLWGTWRQTYNETEGVDALTSFRYVRYSWINTNCGIALLFNFRHCAWETVEPARYLGGAKDGPVAGGDNQNPDAIPSSWDWSATDPGNTWGQSTRSSYHFEEAVGLTVKGLGVTLGTRLESSTDTEVEVEFDTSPPTTDYVEMIAYDRGTDGAIWYFTHRLANETLQATNVTYTSIDLEWTPFEGLDFEAYYIWWRGKGQVEWLLRETASDPANVSLTVAGIAQGFTYEFYVTVKEQSGLFSTTEVIEVKTLGQPCFDCGPGD